MAMGCYSTPLQKPDSLTHLMYAVCLFSSALNSTDPRRGL